MCQIYSKSVEFYESYGKTHFGVFFNAPQCSIRVSRVSRPSRVSRVRVTLTVTVRVSRVSVIVSVRDSVK